MRAAESEQKLRDIFNIPGQRFFLTCTDGVQREFETMWAAKAHSQSKGGEPKTDCYVRVMNLSTGEEDEIKISYKQPNSHWLESKVKPERASQIFGPNWSDRIFDYIIDPLYKYIESSKLYSRSTGKFLLGWRLELMSHKCGVLSCPANDISTEEKLEIYRGALMPLDKRDANLRMIPNEVNSKSEILGVKDSGIADYYLRMKMDNVSDIQSLADNMIPLIKDNVHLLPDIYIKMAGVWYDPYGGDDFHNYSRSLYVPVHYFIGEDNKLAANFSTPTPEDRTPDGYGWYEYREEEQMISNPRYKDYNNIVGMTVDPVPLEWIAAHSKACLDACLGTLARKKPKDMTKFFNDFLLIRTRGRSKWNGASGLEDADIELSHDEELTRSYIAEEGEECEYDNICDMDKKDAAIYMVSNELWRSPKYDYDYDYDEE